MKTFLASLVLSILFVGSAAVAESGQFCSPQHTRVEWLCNVTPHGPGWVYTGNNCYHRDTGMFCSDLDNGYNPFPPAPYFPPPYSPGGHGRLECKSRDKGWEEHGGGHNSCHECLREHGECVETCSTTTYKCETQGVDYRGFTVTFQGEGRDRHEARDYAMRNCSYNANNCRLNSCSSDEDVVSRRNCRR